MALNNISNAILRLRNYPKGWKSANVMEVPKIGNDKISGKVIARSIQIHKEQLVILAGEQQLRIQMQI